MTPVVQIPPLLLVAMLQPFSHKSWFWQCRLMGQKAAGFYYRWMLRRLRAFYVCPTLFNDYTILWNSTDDWSFIQSLCRVELGLRLQRAGSKVGQYHLYLINVTWKLLIRLQHGIAWMHLLRGMLYKLLAGFCIWINNVHLLVCPWLSTVLCSFSEQLTGSHYKCQITTKCHQMWWSNMLPHSPDQINIHLHLDIVIFIKHYYFHGPWHLVSTGPSSLMFST